MANTLETNHSNSITPDRQETGTQQAASRSRPNLACGELLESKENYFKICVPLYNASIKGDWKAAQAIFVEYKTRNLVGFAITENFETALHIAAFAKSSKLMEKFVQKVVNKMRTEELELTNKDGNTALCFAAAAGSVNIARIMLEKNPNLVDIRGCNDMMPLYMATLYGKHDMIDYLYDKSRKMKGESWKDETRSWVVEKCVEADLFDLALKMVTDLKDDMTCERSVLEVLVRKTNAFNGRRPWFIWKIIRRSFAVKVGPAEKASQVVELLKKLWEMFMRLSKDELIYIIRGQAYGPTTEQKYYPSHILFTAAELGNTRFIVELIRLYPDLIWEINDHKQTIFHVAISYRHETIFNLLHEFGFMKDMITALKDDGKTENNMLHLAGERAKEETLQVVSGVAFQMQRELLWFKEVKAMIPPSYREQKNEKGSTPHELFSKEHKDLMSAAEKWMKDTANQCMVVAALITTIVFAAAFTVPGGYNQNSGDPMFLHKTTFIVFVISDAISLAFSSISILIFLSILTSRYAEEDFLEVLPKRLMRGLATLFFSIAAMMVAFSESFFVLYRDNLFWVPIVISVIASMPVILYARLQYDLLTDVYHSTYGYKSLFKQNQFKIYYQNPKM